MSVTHILGISGGKDSAALAVYLRQKYPQLDIDYYFSDTDKELDETYRFIEQLEIYLGKKIKKIPERNSDIDLFDYCLKTNGGYLPSIRSRWCTIKMKLVPFENYVGSRNVISYVGIRGDEDRDAYVSKKDNIQSIFPFRKNIWSDDVISKALINKNLEKLTDSCRSISDSSSSFYQILSQKITPDCDVFRKAQWLLEQDIVLFNKIIYEWLQTTKYPLSFEKDFPLIENTDVLSKEDIFRILEECGVGLPAYYNQIEYDVDGQKGHYSRSRSGCYFCFFQQKIEWIWLYEQHPDLFEKAMSYEKDGYSWMQDEPLSELIKPKRLNDIKRKNIVKCNNSNSSKYLMNAFDEEEACAVCML